MRGSTPWICRASTAYVGIWKNASEGITRLYFSVNCALVDLNQSMTYDTPTVNNKPTISNPRSENPYRSMHPIPPGHAIDRPTLGKRIMAAPRVKKPQNHARRTIALPRINRQIVIRDARVRLRHHLPRQTGRKPLLVVEDLRRIEVDLAVVVAVCRRPRNPAAH